MGIKLGRIANITKLAGFEHSKYIQGNCTHSKTKSSDLPLFIGRTIRNGQIDTNFDWYISKEISDLLVRSKLTKKCIVLPYVGSLGDVAIFDGSYKAHLGSNVAKIELIDNENYCEEYIYYYLKSPFGKKLLLKTEQGAVQKNITMEAIRDVELPNVSLKEQLKTISILKRIDNKIRLNNKINDNLSKQARLYYTQLFINKKPNGLLEEIIIENNKSSIKVNQVKNTHGDYPFFTSGDAILEFNEYFVDKFNCYLNTGGNADVKCYYGRAAYSTDTWSIAGKNNYSIYLYLLLSFIKPELQVKYFLGTGLKHLQKPLLKMRAIYIPTANEIKSLNQYLEPVFKMISSNIDENVKYKNLRDFLLPLLINGQATIS